VELERLLALVLVFVPLSLVSLGGGPSIFAEMQRQAVDVHGWMSDAEFVDLFAISRAAPGPGSLIAALIGWKAAGFLGALVAALGLYLPSSLLVCAVGLLGRRHAASPVRAAIERGLAPVAVGLIFAGALTLLQGSEAGPVGVATTVLATLALLHPRGSPYLVLAAAGLAFAALGAAGFAPR
jgi:chromate transporter